MRYCCGKPPDGGWKQGFPAVFLVTGGAVTQVVDVLDLYAMGSGLVPRSFPFPAHGAGRRSQAEVTSFSQTDRQGPLGFLG